MVIPMILRPNPANAPPLVAHTTIWTRPLVSHFVWLEGFVLSPIMRILTLNIVKFAIIRAENALL